MLPQCSVPQMSKSNKQKNMVNTERKKNPRQTQLDNHSIQVRFETLNDSLTKSESIARIYKYSIRLKLKCPSLFNTGWAGNSSAVKTCVCMALVRQGKPNGVHALVQISEYVRQAWSISPAYLDEINVAIIVRTFESSNFNFHHSIIHLNQVHCKKFGRIQKNVSDKDTIVNRKNERVQFL